MHNLNIPDIFSTLDVSNLEKSILMILPKLKNILLQFLTGVFHFILILFTSPVKSDIDFEFVPLSSPLTYISFGAGVPDHSYITNCFPEPLKVIVISFSKNNFLQLNTFFLEE